MNANRGARIVLHSLERSRSQRILWLLEELKLKYEIQPYKRGPNERAPPELKSIHPIGKAPILSIYYPSVGGTASDGEPDRPINLAESAVIMEHLLDNFHQPSSQAQHALVPARWVAGQENQSGGETETWRQYRYYMHYTEGSLMPLVVTNILMDVVQSAPPFFLKPLVGIVPSILKKEYTGPNFKTHLGYLEDQLATTPGNARYLAGTQFTAADILMSYPLIILREVKVLEKEHYPALWDYINGLTEMEGYRKAVRILEEVEEQKYRPF
ncbi:hypothetical protein BDW74DRAFT_163617 [Aspergillus multicolor]|uniref:glutathione S-transferase family protein n=1 Tax=Aspergillus multicolor TaxID=41759 RepID=UPI003CCD0536